MKRGEKRKGGGGGMAWPVQTNTLSTKKGGWGDGEKGGGSNGKKRLNCASASVLLFTKKGGGKKERGGRRLGLSISSSPLFSVLGKGGKKRWKEKGREGKTRGTEKPRRISIILTPMQKKKSRIKGKGGERGEYVVACLSTGKMSLFGGKKKGEKGKRNGKGE